MKITKNNKQLQRSSKTNFYGWNQLSLPHSQVWKIEGGFWNTSENKLMK